VCLDLIHLGEGGGCMRALLEEASRCEKQVCEADCQMDARKVRLSSRGGYFVMRDSKTRL